MNASPCQADCFRDDRYIRPLKAPNRLVWSYFNVLGHSPTGDCLELRQFSTCECGCGNLIASPSYGKDHAPSLLFSPLPEDYFPEVPAQPVSWLTKIRRWLCQWLCH